MVWSGLIWTGAGQRGDELAGFGDVMADRARHVRFRKVRTPSVLQMEATECGAASLAMILAYYGRRVPLEELPRRVRRLARRQQRAVCQEDSPEVWAFGQGIPHDDGGAARARAAVHGFLGTEPFPGCRGSGRDRVYLNDPASGRRTVSLEEFTESYAGIVFRFEPAPGFRTGGAKPSTTARDRPSDGRRIDRGGVRGGDRRGGPGRRARRGNIRPAVRRPDHGFGAAAVDSPPARDDGACASVPTADRVHAARGSAAAEVVAGGDALGAVCLARAAAADGFLPAGATPAISPVAWTATRRLPTW